jgi:hypothetical protein
VQWRLNLAVTSLAHAHPPAPAGARPAVRRRAVRRRAVRRRAVRRRAAGSCCSRSGCYSCCCSCRSYCCCFCSFGSFCRSSSSSPSLSFLLLVLGSRAEDLVQRARRARLLLVPRQQLLLLLQHTLVHLCLRSDLTRCAAARPRRARVRVSSLRDAAMRLWHGTWPRKPV